MPTLFAMRALIRTRPRGDTANINKLLWAQLMGIFVLLLIRGLSGSSYQVQHPLLIFYMLMQIGVAGLLRLNSQARPHQATIDREEAEEEPDPFHKKRASILSTRRQ
jgi:hypothetical protein